MYLTQIDNLDGIVNDDPIFSDDMAWATPQFKRERVNSAGAFLLKYERLEERKFTDYIDYDEALTVINNWRSSHNFPLNTFQIGLRRRVKQIDSNGIVAQRIKRLSSIKSKLERFNSMKLAQMQDIGGCRAIVANIKKVYALAEAYKKSDIKHPMASLDDYISSPKTSGYRGIHMIYRYFSDRKETYNGLKIEIQIRSALQHAWATAVETVGMFIQQALKSSQGEAEWLRFFQLMGTAIALREDCKIIPNTPSDGAELKTELKKYANSLDVEAHLGAYSAALKVMEEPPQDAHYFLLELEPASKQVRIKGYQQHELEKASNDYLNIEKNQGKQTDAVLVSVDSVAMLYRAYPNYFLDTHLFMEAMKQAIT